MRAEGYLLPKTARLAIVTSTGDLGVDRLSDAGREDRPPAIVLCPLSLVDAVRHRIGDAPAEVIPVPSDGDRLDPATIVATLHARGLERIVCEGGPLLATQFVESGVVDELCVTVSPVLEPARHPFISLTSPHRVGRRGIARGRRGLQLSAASSAALRPCSETQFRMLALHRSWS